MRDVLRSLFGFLVLSPGIVAAPAAAADTAYVVTYFETGASHAGKARALLQQLARASRREAGSVRFEVLQRIAHPDQFVILEAWKSKDAQAAHAGARHTRAFREKLQTLLRGPYDERPHIALAVAATPAMPAGAAKKAAIYTVTHVDIVPKEKDTGVALVKQLSEDGRKDGGNVRFEALTQASRPNHMTVVEIWSGKQPLEVHAVAAHKKAFREKLMPLSGSLYDERFYRAVD
jgi:quinol monooxygenase YgiN